LFPFTTIVEVQECTTPPKFLVSTFLKSRYMVYSTSTVEEDAGGSGAGRARANKKKADAANKLDRMATAGGDYVRSLSFSLNLPSLG
jgi:hypothetical protein